MNAEPEFLYTGDISHVPDSTWSGRGDGYSWPDLDPSVNRSIGSQAAKYPAGYDAQKIIGPLDPAFIEEFDEWRYAR